MAELSEVGMSALLQLAGRTYPPMYPPAVLEYENQWFIDVLAACEAHGVTENAPVVSDIDRFFSDHTQLAAASVSLGGCCAVLIEACQRGAKKPTDGLRALGKAAIGQINYRWQEKRSYA
jgi:hypothetical protein